MKKLDKESIKRWNDNLEKEKRSRDELVGYIIRYSHEDDYCTPVDYKSVMSVLKGLGSYFE